MYLTMEINPNTKFTNNTDSNSCMGKILNVNSVNFEVVSVEEQIN